jgi:CP family cyanate transporter-like MFS transporter
MTAAGRYRWILLSVYLFASSAPLLVQFSLGVMLPDISDDLGLSDAEQGVLGAVGWLGTLLLYLPLTAWFARYSPASTTNAVTAFGVLAILLQVVAPGFALTLLGRFLLVVPFIAQGPARTALVQRWFHDHEIATVNGLTIAAMGITEIIAIWCSPLLIDSLGGWRAALVVYAVLTAISLVTWALVARERPGAPPATHHAAQGSLAALRSALRRSDVRWLMVAGLGTAMTWSGFFTFWPTYAVDSQGLDLETAGFIWGLGSVALTAISFAAGPMARRFGRRRPLIMLSTVLNAPTFLAMLVTDNIALLCLFALLMGASWFFIPIINTIPFELPNIQPREVSMVWALYMVASNLGTTLGPLFIGTFGEFTPGLGLPLAISNVFLLITVVALLFLPETGQPRTTREVKRADAGAAAG